MKKTVLLFFFFCAGFFCHAQHKGTLLVVNKAENSVSVINLSTSKVIATIPVGNSPHEVAVSSSGKKAAVSNYGDASIVSNSITVIDVIAKQKIKTIDLGSYQRPHGIEFINEDECIVTCEAKNLLLLVNTNTNSITELANTAQLGSHMVAWSATDKKAYVANVHSGSVSVIDVVNKKLVTVIPFQPGVEGLDVSPDGTELWVANRNDSSVTVINTSTKEILAVLPAHQVAFRVKFLPDGKYVLVSNGLSGNITVYDAKEKKVLKDIDVTAAPGLQPVLVGVAVNRNSEFFYVCLAGDNKVAVISTKNWSIVKRINTGKEPDGVYYAPLPNIPVQNIN